jgi:hypothetical protein
VNGFGTYGLDGMGLTGAPSNGWSASGTSAENGTAIVVQPGGNEVTLFHPQGSQNPQSDNIPVGTMPYTSVMATLGGVTRGFVASVDSPTLWKLTTSGTFVGSTPLTGVTSLSDINAAGHVLGGWPMAVFHSGTNVGKIGFVDAYGQKLLIFDGMDNSMPLLKTVPLPCPIPSAVDAIDATGQFRVSCIKVAGFTDSGTTFLGIDPAAGTATPLEKTSTKFPLGFLADADNLYVFQGSGAPDVQPNK